MRENQLDALVAFVRDIAYEAVHDPTNSSGIGNAAEKKLRAAFRVETRACHPDPTGTTREPPHCPTCACGLLEKT